MRSFVLALTKWFPELTQPQLTQQLPIKEPDELPPLSDSDSDNEKSDSDAQDDQHWERLERLREKFERLRQKESDALEQQKNLQPIDNDKKPESPQLIQCVYRILERQSLL